MNFRLFILQWKFFIVESYRLAAVAEQKNQIEGMVNRANEILRTKRRDVYNG